MNVFSDTIESLSVENKEALVLVFSFLQRRQHSLSVNR